MDKITQSAKNRLRWNNTRFFVGAVDIRTGAITETHTWEEGECAGWDFYLTDTFERQYQEGAVKLFRLWKDDDPLPTIDWEGGPKNPKIEAPVQRAVEVVPEAELSLAKDDYIQVPDEYGILSMEEGQLYVTRGLDTDAHHTVAFRKEGYFFTAPAYNRPGGGPFLFHNPGARGEEGQGGLNRFVGVKLEGWKELIYGDCAPDGDNPFFGLSLEDVCSEIIRMEEDGEELLEVLTPMPFSRFMQEMHGELARQYPHQAESPGMG